MQVVGELATTVQSLSIRQIKLNQRNSRTHSAKQIRQIANSIMAFGFTNPLLITEDGTLIAGEGRYKAAQLLGLVKVPLIVLTGLSPARLRALAIADNKIGENAGWDRERLAIEIPELAGLLETEGLDVTDLWGRTLRRRSQKDRMTWARMTQLVDPGFQNRSSYILGRVIALPSHTQGGSRMREAARTVLCGGRAMSDLVQHVGDGKARMAQRLTRARPGTAVASLRYRCPGRSDLGIGPHCITLWRSAATNRGVSKCAADVAASVEPDRKCMGCLGITNERGLP